MSRITWSVEACKVLLSLLVDTKEARARYNSRSDNKKLNALNQSIVERLCTAVPGVPFDVSRIKNKAKSLNKSWRAVHRSAEEKRNRGGTPEEIKTITGTYHN